MVFKRFSFIKGREFYQQTKEHFILQFIRKEKKRDTVVFIAWEEFK